MEKSLLKKYIDKLTWIFTGVYMALFAGCFISQAVYSVVSRYASLASFFVLGMLSVAYFYKERVSGRADGSDIVGGLRFIKEYYEIVLVAIGIFVAGFNLVIIGSNKGAFFTAANLLLMLYLSDKISFSRRQLMLMSGAGSVILLAWYVYVRWDYNFNMAGLVFMTMCISCLLFFEQMKARYGYLGLMQPLCYLVALLFCILYHSRCAMMGLLIFGVIYLMYPLICRYRALKYFLIFLATAGSILFTLLYVALGQTGWNLTILYKDILSGRQDIWQELWGAFLAQPLTGIGSSYVMKSFFIFEVHNGLLDILVVHGLIVFMCVIVLLVKKLDLFMRGLVCSAGGVGDFDSELEHAGGADDFDSEFEHASGARNFYSGMALDVGEISRGNGNRIVLAAVYAMLFTSFFENFFIVSPYLLVLLVLMSYSRTRLLSE